MTQSRRDREKSSGTSIGVVVVKVVVEVVVGVVVAMSGDCTLWCRVVFCWVNNSRACRGVGAEFNRVNTRSPTKIIAGIKIDKNRLVGPLILYGFQPYAPPAAWRMDG